MSYKSPIEIIYHDQEFRVETVEASMEETVIKAIQSYDINVDKDELIKALAYDRGQYEKGYADGKEEAGSAIGQIKIEKRSQVERVAIANALLAGVWAEIMDGHTERGVLQEAVYAQTSVNRIVWKLNEINNKGQEEQP